MIKNTYIGGWPHFLCVCVHHEEEVHFSLTSTSYTHTDLLSDIPGMRKETKVCFLSMSSLFLLLVSQEYSCGLPL